MAGNEKAKPNPLKPYYHSHPTSYNTNMAYKSRPYTGNSKIKDMIDRAEQAISDNEFKG